MHILVVEDEPGIARFVKQGLREAGFAADIAHDGREGLDFALAAPYDAIVLDILLPHLDGLRVLREVRAHGVKVPVLLLTARDAVDDRVAGLDAGADDYLVKPFAFAELLARLRALLRRPPLQADPVLRVDDLALDLARRMVRRGDRAIDLSPREFALLEYLMRHAGQVLTRTQIVDHVWHYDFASDSNVLDVYIGYLRRKVDRGADNPLIQTVRGVGYRLSAETSDA